MYIWLDIASDVRFDLKVLIVLLIFNRRVIEFLSDFLFVFLLFFCFLFFLGGVLLLLLLLQKGHMDRKCLVPVNSITTVISYKDKEL